MKESDLQARIASRPFTVPRLFAYGENANVNLVDSSSSGFSFYSGIPPMYSSRNGKKVNRRDINGLVRLMTQASFFNQSGGYHTFSKEVSSAIGGYPLGAILKYYDSDKKELRCVRSLVANNEYDFVENPEYIDNVRWQYVDEIVPSGFRPRIFPDFPNKKEGMLYVGQSTSVSSVDDTMENSFMAKMPMLFIIQSGMGSQDSEETTSDETGAYLWVSVRRSGETEFHSAGMLGYTAPVSALMNAYGRSAAFIDSDIEEKANYTSFYSSSPIHIYLNTGDVVKISENREFYFTAKYVAYPLKA